MKTKTLKQSSELTASTPPFITPFITYEQFYLFVKSLSQHKPIVKGKLWPHEDHATSWSIECDSYIDFCESTRDLCNQIQFFTYNESFLNSDTLDTLRQELQMYADEQEINYDTVSKALSALRSHENDQFEVTVHAFLNTGTLIFTRIQNELARYIYHPDQLLTSEGILQIRKLRTLQI